MPPTLFCSTGNIDNDVVALISTLLLFGVAVPWLAFNGANSAIRFYNSNSERTARAASIIEGLQDGSQEQKAGMLHVLGCVLQQNNPSSHTSVDIKAMILGGYCLDDKIKAVLAVLNVAKGDRNFGGRKTILAIADAVNQQYSDGNVMSGSQDLQEKSQPRWIKGGW